MTEDDSARDQTIGSWLDELASAAPTPGGGAAAAISAALGAALVAMVCNLTIGKPRYAEHEPLMCDALSSATRLRAHAVRLAADDSAAFSAVADAYRLPSTTSSDKAARGEAIQDALVAAAEVALRTATVAAAVIAEAGRILDGANINVISDVAVAATSARAGLTAAEINVEINLKAMRDQERAATLRTELEQHRQQHLVADQILATVRHRIGQ